jgi:hypothetical protein
MVGAECVLEPSMGGAWIDEVCPSQLPHISQALKNVGVDEVERDLIDPNVIPDRIAQYLEANRFA